MFKEEQGAIPVIFMHQHLSCNQHYIALYEHLCPQISSIHKVSTEITVVAARSNLLNNVKDEDFLWNPAGPDQRRRASQQILCDMIGLCGCDKTSQISQYCWESIWQTSRTCHQFCSLTNVDIFILLQIFKNKQQWNKICNVKNYLKQ